jgi:excinuclease ABC subunit C
MSETSGIDGTASDAPEREATTSLADGIAVLQQALAGLPNSPGVYRMLSARDEALYVGKANSLKKRVAAYTQPTRLTARLIRMVAATARLEYQTTASEAEALLLESNLIKRLKPRYNILLRDDKSFPYIIITTGDRWPQLAKYRGPRTGDAEYFGPFASAGAVNQMVRHYQRAFPLRSCSDAVFASRTRPCLLYQIKRCSAPCVGKIGHDDYMAMVDEARAFLRGESDRVRDLFAARMEEASERLEFEKAAEYRDRIRAFAHIRGHQDINVERVGEADVIAVHETGGQACIQVVFYRGGQNFGNRAYFPAHVADSSAADVLGAFLGQFYDNKPIPKQVLLSERIEGQELLAEALSIRAGHKVSVTVPRRGPRRSVVQHALDNAKTALGQRLAESATQRRLLEQLAETFDLDGVPERIEVYDNSHIQGSHAVGAMIVAGPEGFVKNAYRKFNIRSTQAAAKAGGDGDGLAEAAVPFADAGAAPGDDYAMMREVLTRRFARALKEDPERASGQWPDLLLIDGGRGQLRVADEVLAELGIDDIAVVGVAKGPDRDAGRETFHLPDGGERRLPQRDPVLYFVQRLRDEAHRFAIGAHRQRRAKAQAGSPLDAIPGIGARRKKALLLHFGSARAVARAGLADIEQVAGISGTVAKRIYEHFHDGT